MFKFKQLFRRLKPPPELANTRKRSLAERVFAATGLSINTLIAIGLIMVISAVAIGYTVLSKADAERRQNQTSVTVVDTRTAEQKLTDCFLFDPSFPNLPAVERIAILESRIQTCEEIFANPSTSAIAIDELIGLWGITFSVKISDRLDTEREKTRLSELRQLASDSGDFNSVGLAEILIVNAELTRLGFQGELDDYRTLADTIIAIDESHVQSLPSVQNTQVIAVDLYEKSNNKEQDGQLMNLLGEKISKSPIEEIADIGRMLMDYPNFRDFFDAQASRSFLESETKQKLLEDLYDQLQKTPPQSSVGCRTLIRLFDSLYNPTDVKYILPLAERLQQRAASFNTEAWAEIEQALANVKRRASAIGAKVNLTGRDLFEVGLRLSPKNNTLIIFLDFNQPEAGQTLLQMLGTGRFDSWNTDFLVASTENIAVEDLKKIAQKISGSQLKAKFLNAKTASRLMSTLGIDQTPIVATIDSENRVVRFEKQL